MHKLQQRSQDHLQRSKLEIHTRDQRSNTQAATEVTRSPLEIKSQMQRCTECSGHQIASRLILQMKTRDHHSNGQTATEVAK